MIPGAAVEAALNAFAQAPYLVTNEEQMKLALEAAAPHMLKSAYDLGFEHGSNESSDPYRSKL